MTGEPVAVLTGVTKVYPGPTPTPTLKGISLTIRQGEYLAVEGRSGSGKSTLLNVLGCLDVPTGGSYALFGTDVARCTREELADLRNGCIGFVFQSFQLLPRLTAYENAELPLIYAGLPGRERKRRVLDRLQALGLGDKAHRLPGELSGGEQQRVAIARALVTQPALLLADEPTGNLDVATGQEVMQLLEGLHRAGQTLVLVTHDRSLAARAERRIELRDGRMVEGAPAPAEVGA